MIDSSVRVVNEKEQERQGGGEGLCPLPRKFFDFLSGNGAFWGLVLMLV